MLVHYFNKSFCEFHYRTVRQDPSRILINSHHQNQQMQNIIIAAECPRLWNKLHKIRIIRNHQQQQVASDESGLTRDGIQAQIVAYMNMTMTMNKEDINSSSNNITTLTSDDILVEIYHPDESFVPLLRDANDKDSPLDDAFGTRIRCIIHLQQNRDTNSIMQNDDDDGPLLIKGRYFEYNPDGMDLAGKQLIIKEVVNNKEEDGTGLNVWDGSLLLARFLEKNPEKVSTFGIDSHSSLCDARRLYKLTTV